MIRWTIAGAANIEQRSCDLRAPSGRASSPDVLRIPLEPGATPRLRKPFMPKRLLTTFSTIVIRPTTAYHSSFLKMNKSPDALAADHSRKRPRDSSAHQRSFDRP